MRKMDLIELLLAKVSADTAPDNETVSVEVQLAKLEIEREHIRQHAPLQPAVPEWHWERMTRDFEGRQKEMKQEKQILQLEERKIANMEVERTFDLSRSIRLVPQ